MSLEKIAVIIPCYEPSKQKFIPYVQSLFDKGVKNVVIVNDGSGEKYEDIFGAIKGIGKEKIHYLSYEKNRGKGYALKFAFKYCKENFDSSTVFVTADCDGQHRVDDVIKVGIASQENPLALILGARDFSLDNVPKRSRSGNVNTRNLMKFFYGIKLTDTQTGLRSFSYSMLDTLLSISGDRFEYETNQLIYIHQKGGRIKEVGIETVYEKKAEDVEKISHFKTFSDSVRVVGVLLKNLGWYFFSSVLSAIIDVAVFALLFSVILQIPSLTLKTLVATVSARVLSSIVNFTCNYKLVFHGNSKKSVFRYYVLWLVQLGASFGLARLWAGVTDIEVLVSVLKAASDIVLAIISYQVQCNWVFAKKDARKFYGGFARLAKRLMRLFTKKYKAVNVDKDTGACVYVCRHLNMHGCYTSVRTMPFDVHIMSFGVFFTFKSAFKHFSEVTFAKGGKATLGSKLKAFFPALFIPPLLKSSKAVPVFRKSASSYSTLKKASDYLLKGESILLFPDVDYKASQEENSEIYKGFLLLERFYYKQTNKHLKFIPLYIDDKERTLSAHNPIAFGEGEFDAQREAVAGKIHQAIRSKPLDGLVDG